MYYYLIDQSKSGCYIHIIAMAGVVGAWKAAVVPYHENELQ